MGDLSCSKKIVPGNPKPMECADHLEWGGAASAGLCYDPCPKGYYGIGPMCHRHEDCQKMNPTPKPVAPPSVPAPAPVSTPSSEPAPVPAPPVSGNGGTTAPPP